MMVRNPSMWMEIMNILDPAWDMDMAWAVQDPAWAVQDMAWVQDPAWDQDPEWILCLSHRAHRS